ncbi:hypothetical protein T484DRAFT_1765820 [Baffinella frigidus]|nr:hypothetical protein T484DRAFT_1765820 [Cryptophyta sp. CCMP2293]
MLCGEERARGAGEEARASRDATRAANEAVDEAQGELQCANAEVAALRERVSDLEGGQERLRQELIDAQASRSESDCVAAEAAEDAQSMRCATPPSNPH